MPRRANQRPEGEDSSLALDTRSRAVIQQLVDEKRAALEAAAPHIPLEEYLHGGQDSLQSSIKRMRDAAASFASAGELVAPAAPAADDTARAHHSTDVAGSGTLGPGSATRRPASAPHSRTGAMGQRGAAGGTGEAPSLQRPAGHARARALPGVGVMALHPCHQPHHAGPSLPCGCAALTRAAALPSLAPASHCLPHRSSGGRVQCRRPPAPQAPRARPRMRTRLLRRASA